jgi:hypothetical protein
MASHKGNKRFYTIKQVNGLCSSVQSRVWENNKGTQITIPITMLMNRNQWKLFTRLVQCGNLQ